MIDPETVAGALDGHVLRGPSKTGAYICDYCGDPVEYGTRVSVYVADTDYNIDEKFDAELRPHRVYCSTCDRRSVSFPHEGTNEVMLEGEAVLEGGVPTFVDVEPVDFSPEDDGIPWDPAHVWSQFLGMRLGPFLEDQDIEAFGPEDVVDQLRLFDVEVPDHVDYEGRITVPKNERDELRERVRRGMMEHLRERMG